MKLSLGQSVHCCINFGPKAELFNKSFDFGQYGTNSDFTKAWSTHG